MKEKALMAVVGVIVMFAVAVGFWFLSAESAWKKAAKQYDKACETFAKEERLIAQKNKWNEAYEAEKAAMPMFADGQATDTTWLRKVEELAAAINEGKKDGKKAKRGSNDYKMLQKQLASK